MIGNVYTTINPDVGLVTVIRANPENKHEVIVYSLNFKKNIVINKESISELMIPIDQNNGVDIIQKRLNNLFSQQNIGEEEFFRRLGLKVNKRNLAKYFNLEKVDAKLLNKVCDAFYIPIEELCCIHKTTKYD